MASLFPNVPNLPGVPPLPRLPGSVTSAVLTVGSGVISALLGQSAKRRNLWGIFDNTGNQVPLQDSVLEFAYRRQFDVSDFPVVKGAFASYNKVQRPYEIQVRLSKAGTQSDRAQFLNAIDSMLSSTSLYTIRTPEKSYSNCNPDRAEVSRTGPKDAFFLTQVDLYFIQIVQTTPQYTNTAVNTSNAQSSAALPTSNVGTVQPQAPSGVLLSSGQSALQSAGKFPSLF